MLERYKKILSEMAVHSKVRNSDDNYYRIKQIDNLFRNMFEKIKGTNYSYILNDNYERMKPNESSLVMAEKQYISYHVSLKFKEAKGYFEVNNTIKKIVSDFKNRVKSIGKVNWGKEKIENDISYRGEIEARMSLSGYFIMSEIIPYLYDGNTGKKHKLGVYHFKSEAESDAGNLYGYMLSKTHNPDRKHKIFYFTRKGRGENIIKEFDFNKLAEAEKYYNKMKIEIELVNR